MTTQTHKVVRIAFIDTDGDGVADSADNCPSVANPAQADFDQDGQGDACDADDDNDGVIDGQDAFPFDPTEWIDSDHDGIGNNADPDDDNDGDPDASDCSILDPAVHHGAAEILGNGVDDNCDGVIDASTLFTVSGLLPPYAVPPATFRTGRAIPIKWQFTDSTGAVVDSATAAPALQMWGPLPCGADSGGVEVAVSDSGASGYHYDPTTRVWGYNLKATGATPGCYLLQVTSTLSTPSALYPIQLR